MTKEIIKTNKKYLAWHWVLFGLIALGLISKILMIMAAAAGMAAWFKIILIIFVSLFSVIALVGLGLYKKWSYWFILVVFAFSSFEANVGLVDAIINLLIAAPIPIYLLYKISQENKSGQLTKT